MEGIRIAYNNLIAQFLYLIDEINIQVLKVENI